MASVTPTPSTSRSASLRPRHVPVPSLRGIAVAAPLGRRGGKRLRGGHPRARGARHPYDRRAGRQRGREPVAIERTLDEDGVQVFVVCVNDDGRRHDRRLRRGRPRPRTPSASTTRSSWSRSRTGPTTSGSRTASRDHRRRAGRDHLEDARTADFATATSRRPRSARSKDSATPRAPPAPTAGPIVPGPILTPPPADPGTDIGSEGSARYHPRARPSRGRRLPPSGSGVAARRAGGTAAPPERRPRTMPCPGRPSPARPTPCSSPPMNGSATPARKPISQRPSTAG